MKVTQRDSLLLQKNEEEFDEQEVTNHLPLRRDSNHGLETHRSREMQQQQPVVLIPIQLSQQTEMAWSKPPTYTDLFPDSSSIMPPSYESSKQNDHCYHQGDNYI